MKQFMYLLLLSCLFLSGCHSTYVRVPATGLPGFLNDPQARVPQISAHRGGGGYPGYPENCLASFRYLARQAPMIIECDVRLSADSVLVLLHDATLERTTTGQGPLQQQPWASLDTMHLEDNFGARTPYGIPRLDEALTWGKHKVLFTLDVKRGVPFERVVRCIQRANAQPYAIVITYNAADAAALYALDSTLTLSVGIRGDDDRQQLRALGIPYRNMVAFTGTSLCDPQVYADNHALGIPNLLGTLGKLDQQAQAQGDSLYLRWLDQGLDILSTDRPVELARLLKRQQRLRSSP